ncbi:MAG TPA: TonB-dependent receptor, partial [Salinimicrobium catena]|nr:TonB-dependent receptor [Salinimicrobium catena]
FSLYDLDGDGDDEITTPFTEDASFGAQFDPSRMIYQWNSIYPQLESTYLQPSPWTAGEHTPNDFWETGYTAINSVALDGGTEKSSFRLGVTNLLQEGNLPNSEIKRNTVIFSGTHDFTDDLSAGANITYAKTDGRGRYGTGYDSANPMQQFRQWWQTNVDLYEQRDAYLATGENITWNPNSPTNLSPIYSDNPYFTRYENFQTDTRNRYFGNFNLDYQINDIFSVIGRFSFDTYDELQEERINVGSADVSEYQRFNNRFAEYNYDLILNFNTDLTDDLNLDGLIGANLRRNDQTFIRASTNGGLNAPGFYSLSNSAGPLLPPVEYDATEMVDGIYARAGLGYLDTYFLEGTIRRDRSSTLPIDNNTFYYPSVSGSFILSNLIDSNALNFAKLRANYAEVGSATDPYRVFNTYTILAPFAGAPWATNNSQLNNIALKPERAKSYEVGLEANFWDRRIGFDVSYYNTQTEDQITPVPVSNATGFVTTLLNAGTIENKGLEVQLTLNPVRTEDFNWNMNINWAKNENTVLSLAEGIDNLQLAALQGGVSINAAPGQPYGAIRGTDYVYDENGNKVVNSSGYYLKSSTSNEIIGNVQPDWTGGVSNTFSYKNLTLDFLIDVQKGGDIFSLDTWYGFATGLYDITTGTNDLGNPKRNPLSQGGGIILPGVTEDGEPNTTRARFDYYANPYGYARDANKGHVYDASFVKLREANLTYQFGEKILDRIPFTDASISLIGRNLWIIHKNLPYSDPEAGLSAGNIQGYQSGAYPAIREVGASVKFNF